MKKTIYSLAIIFASLETSLLSALDTPWTQGAKVPPPSLDRAMELFSTPESLQQLATQRGIELNGAYFSVDHLFPTQMNWEGKRLGGDARAGFSDSSCGCVLISDIGVVARFHLYRKLLPTEKSQTPLLPLWGSLVLTEQPAPEKTSWTFVTEPNPYAEAFTATAFKKLLKARSLRPLAQGKWVEIDSYVYHIVGTSDIPAYFNLLGKPTFTSNPRAAASWTQLTGSLTFARDKRHRVFPVTIAVE